MSNSDRIREQLSAYLDGELSDTEREKIERAIEGDEKLARELRELLTVRRLLGDLPRTRPSEQFVSQVLGRAERAHLTGSSTEHAPPPHLSWVRWVASAAVLLIAAGICVVITAVLSRPSFTDRLAEGPRSVGRIARDLGDLPQRKVTAADKESGEKPTGSVVRESDTPAGIAEDRKKESFELGRRGKMKLGKEQPTETLTQGIHAKADTDETRSSEAADSTLEKDLAAVENEIVFTHDLPETQRQVEEVLKANRLVPRVIESRKEEARTERVGRKGFTRSVTYALLPKRAPRQVQYLAYVTPQQRKNVTAELDNIRGGQLVSQVTLCYAMRGRRRDGSPQDAAVHRETMQRKEQPRPASAPVGKGQAVLTVPCGVAAEAHEAESPLKEPIDESSLSAPAGSSEGIAGGSPVGSPPAVERGMRSGPGLTGSQPKKSLTCAAQPTSRLAAVDVQPLLITLNLRPLAEETLPESPRQPPTPHPLTASRPTSGTDARE